MQLVAGSILSGALSVRAGQVPDGSYRHVDLAAQAMLITAATEGRAIESGNPGLKSIEGKISAGSGSGASGSSWRLRTCIWDSVGGCRSDQACYQDLIELRNALAHGNLGDLVTIPWGLVAAFWPGRHDTTPAGPVMGCYGLCFWITESGGRRPASLHRGCGGSDLAAVRVDPVAADDLGFLDGQPDLGIRLGWQGVIGGIRDPVRAFVARLRRGCGSRWGMFSTIRLPPRGGAARRSLIGFVAGR
jgi:hypothetical protein